MAELFWMDRAGTDALVRRVAIEGLDRAACNATRGAAAIYPTLHFSNFEWLGLLCAVAVERGFVVAQRFRNPLLGPIFDRVRAVTGHEVLPQERVMLRMLKHLKSGGKFGMLADLSLDPGEGSVVVTQFGGLQTSVTQLHAALALRTGAQLVPVVMLPTATGTYRAVFHEAVAFDAAIPAHIVCQRTWDALEPAIRAHPECWLWSYKHWRFRPSEGDTDRYPAYSNTAKRFDKLLRKTAS
jgi:lauroyl/myristoyl acyltransferase